MNMKSTKSRIFSMRSFRVIATLIALAVVSLMSGRAYADEELPKPAEESARAHFDTGNTAFRSAQSRTDPSVQRTEYETAIQEYIAGLTTETKFHYSFYWNLGHAYRQLGAYTRAEHFYKKFLEFAPARFALHRTAAEDFIRMMRAEMDKAATLAEPTAPAPAPMRDRAEGAPPGGAHRNASPTWYQDRGGWILAGVGIATVATGAGFLVSGRSLANQANREPNQRERLSLRDDSSFRTKIGAVAGGVGLAVLGAGVIKLILTPGAARRGESIQVSVAPRWIAIQGSF